MARAHSAVNTAGWVMANLRCAACRREIEGAVVWGNPSSPAKLNSGDNATDSADAEPRTQQHRSPGDVPYHADCFTALRSPLGRPQLVSRRPATIYLTLLARVWDIQEGQPRRAEPIRYEVMGLPRQQQAFVNRRPNGRWQVRRIVRDIPGNWFGDFATAEEALPVLQALLERSQE